MHQQNHSNEWAFSEKHHEVILNIMTEGILELTPEGAIVYANPAAVSIIGISEDDLPGSNFADLFSGTDRQRIQKQLEEMGDKRQPIKDTCRISPNDKHISVNLMLVGENEHKYPIVILNDVSEQQQMEAQLQRAERMEAIGTLAGGVAHDLNNILSGLVSYPELLLLQLPEDNPLRKPLHTIQKAGEKAAAVVQDLLTLARRGVVVSGVVNLNDVITEYLRSPECKKLKTYHPGVDLETRFAADALNITGSSTHLSKTVMNLISNAAEAMPLGGRITVSTENRYMDRPIRGYDNVQEGDYLVLTVADTGMGISPDDIKKIFEPFYTKKKMGRSGTGLGMTVVWGTVKDHNGYIDVQSTEGEGTTFTLYFPVTREKPLEDKSELFNSSIMGNGESVLIVDDVREQRKIASAMLKELGYATCSVASGEEAVKSLETCKVDLLVLDMIMEPGMDGLDTYRKILELHPGQKAIIASGFSETGRISELRRLGAGEYVKKPFLLEKIGLAVKRELGKR